MLVVSYEGTAGFVPCRARLSSLEYAGLQGCSMQGAAQMR